MRIKNTWRAIALGLGVLALVLGGLAVHYKHKADLQSVADQMYYCIPDEWDFGGRCVVEGVEVVRIGAGSHE